MCDRLGDRDYDSFEADEHQHLKKKIGFAFFGPPQNNDGGYKMKQNEQMQAILQQLLKVSSKLNFNRNFCFTTNNRKKIFG